MERYVCIHGHFYQPPRENPWLEAVELQDSAYPYHDWNERISAQCYTPNTAARILDDNHWIKQIINNYTRISFNFGPTLLDWLEDNEPEVYRAVIEADRESQKKFSGHGSAFAQAYNHMIMPLANSNDKHTQVVWGIRDFQRRFGRQPEGMWLPETAVDLETLCLMADQGIKFTVLAPYQAKRCRILGGEEWELVGPRGIDPSMVYLLDLPAGRTINIIFYDGPISSAVAFEHLLSNGERFANRLLSGFAEARAWPQLVNIATDGETYGHHHPHGEMALAYALQYIESNKLARVTNYAQFLQMHPPTHQVEIHENTAWSCAHGVDRWQGECGCNTGMHPGWNQAWRTPLREAMNWLRDTLSPRYEEHARRLFLDPWEARNDYIDVLLDRSQENQQRFLAEHAVRELDEAERITALKLLEMQRHAMLMFTSCGWFFDELSGIETIQVMQYAGRVIQLAEELFGLPLERRFLEMLAQAKSNDPGYRDGARIYEKHVRPAMVDLPKVGVHYALSSLFEEYGKQTRIFCYTVDRLHNLTYATGKAKLAVGQMRITSQITRESVTLGYGAFFFGTHNLNGSVRLFESEEAYLEMAQVITGAFNRGDLPEVIRLLDGYFGKESIYSLKQLFRDQQRKVLVLILESSLTEIAADYRRLYNRHVSLMRFLKNLGIPLPQGLQCAADFHLNRTLRRSFTSEVLDLASITATLDEAKQLDLQLDGEGLGYFLKKAMERVAEQLAVIPLDLTPLENLDALAGLARSLPFDIDLSRVQEIYYRLAQTIYPKMLEKSARGDEHSKLWLGPFQALGDKVKVLRES